MKILAIDPGPTESAWVLYDTDSAFPLLGFGKHDSETVVLLCLGFKEKYEHLAVEMVQHYGPDCHAGKEVFDTCVFIGRFIQAAIGNGVEYTLLYRTKVKAHVCGLANVKDKHIRQSLIDRWGGDSVAIGRKASPGPLFGISGDVWSALAVAVTYADTRAASATPVAAGGGR